jgi:hypothetical protein
MHVVEQEALHWCAEFGNGPLLTDDTAARLAAQSLGIAGHGTWGVLIRAIRRQCLTKAKMLALRRTISFPAHPPGIAGRSDCRRGSKNPTSPREAERDSGSAKRPGNPDGRRLFSSPEVQLTLNIHSYRSRPHRPVLRAILSDNPQRDAVPLILKTSFGGHLFLFFQ